MHRVVPFIFIIIAGCNDPLKNSFHPAYFEPVLKITDSLADNNLQDSAIVYLKKWYALSTATGIGDLAEKYKRLAEYYTNTKKDISLAIGYTDSSISLLSPYTADKRLATLYAHAFIQKGNVYLNINKYDQAIENYNLGKLAIFQKLGDHDCAMWMYYESMANLSYAQGNYANALDNFKKRFALIQNCYAGFLNFQYTQADLDNIGICYAEMNHPDSALLYYRKALAFIESEKNKFPEKKRYIERAILIVYKNAAEAAYSMDSLKTGEAYLLKGLDDAIKFDIELAFDFRFELFYFYLAKKEFEKAGKIIPLLWPSIPEPVTDYSRTKGFYYELLDTYYTNLNDTGSAYRAFRKSILIKDSLARRDKQFASTDLKKEFEYREQKILNESLQKDSKLKNVYLWLAIVTLLLGVMIIVFVLQNLFHSRRHVKEVNDLNVQITEQNAELRNSLVSLEQSHDENTRLVRVVAHDLLNPIGGVRNLAYSLLLSEPSAQRRDSLTLINNTCTDSLQLIKELLTQKNKASKPSIEKVDLKKLVERSVKFLQQKADEKNQHLSMQAQPAVVLGNEQQIWRVISNIINNAIKFSPANSSIHVKLDTFANTTVFSVRDNGIGIPEKLYDKLFSINTEKGREGTSGEQSHGLGLSIVHKIVTEHDGKIWFESKIGIGSTFFVELPLINSLPDFREQFLAV